MDDEDCDGSRTTADCDDANAAVHPGATERVGNGTDDDCDGLELCYADADGDGHGSARTVESTNLACSDSGEAGSSDDCDDSADRVFPGAEETPGNGVDDECDGVEFCYTDADGDGYGSTAPQRRQRLSVLACCRIHAVRAGLSRRPSARASMAATNSAWLKLTSCPLAPRNAPMDTAAIRLFPSRKGWFSER